MICTKTSYIIICIEPHLRRCCKCKLRRVEICYKVHNSCWFAQKQVISPSVSSLTFHPASPSFLWPFSAGPPPASFLFLLFRPHLNQGWATVSFSFCLSLYISLSFSTRSHSTEARGQMFAIPLTLLASSAAPNVGAGASPSWSSPIFEPRCWHSTQQGRTWQVWNRVKWVQPSYTFMSQRKWDLFSKLFAKSYS